MKNYSANFGHQGDGTALQQTTVNKPLKLDTEVPLQQFYSVSIMFSHANCLEKTLKLPLILFAYIRVIPPFT